MRQKVPFLLLACGLMILLVGCSRLSSSDTRLKSPSALEPQTLAKFTDIPVPVGFHYQQQVSYAFETAGVRVGLLKYAGKANPDMVTAFYKEQMPLYNWRLLNVIEYNERILNFDREGETCIVSLLPKGGNVTITVAIGPKSQFTSSIPERGERLRK